MNWNARGPPIPYSICVRGGCDYRVLTTEIKWSRTDPTIYHFPLLTYLVHDNGVEPGQYHIQTFIKCFPCLYPSVHTHTHLKHPSTILSLLGAWTVICWRNCKLGEFCRKNCKLGEFCRNNCKLGEFCRSERMVNGCKRWVWVWTEMQEDHQFLTLFV